MVQTKKVDVKVGRAKIRAELADTITKKTIGLSFRRALRKGDGMLFVFDEETRHPFWMFGMRFPIDMVWIDGKRRVVDITENATPCRSLLCKIYRPKKKARYVLEVNAGVVRKNKIKIGDKITF